MIKKTIRYLLMALIAIIPLVAVAPALPVRADSSIGVSPSTIIDSSVSSGSAKTYTVTVTNGFALDIEVDGLGQTTGGSTIGVSAQNDTTPFTARPWVSVDKNHLEPGIGQTLIVTVNVPSGTAPGERYAAIFLHTPDSSGVISGILIPMILTIDAGYFTPNISGQITDLSVPSAIEGEIIDFLISLSNTGNCRITNARNKVTLKDSSQAVIWESELPLVAPSIIPGYPRVMDILYEAGLDMGYYSITSDFTLPGGTLDSKTLNFTVVEAPAWDVNRDHICDVLDLILVGMRIEETGAPGWIPEDINRDGVINVLDLIEIGNYIGQTW